MIAFLAMTALAANPIADAYFQSELRDPFTAHVEQIKPPEAVHYVRKCGVFERGCVPGPRDAIAHCYRVNAKNAYGAYTGWQTYLLKEESGAIVRAFTDESRTSLEAEEVHARCAPSS